MSRTVSRRIKEKPVLSIVPSDPEVGDPDPVDEQEQVESRASKYAQRRKEIAARRVSAEEEIAVANTRLKHLLKQMRPAPIDIDLNDQMILPGLPGRAVLSPPSESVDDYNPNPDADSFDTYPETGIVPGPSWEERDPTLPGADKEFRVSLHKDHHLVYPDLWLRVYVAGTRYEEAQFAEMFVRAGCTRAISLDEADLCVFTGGPDVNPAYYGEEPHPKTNFSDARDDADVGLYVYCLKHGIPMFGVCRGAQFLHVMNGGKLYQHVDGHNGDHNMWDVVSQTMVDRVSSVHHQSCIQNCDEGMTLLGTSSIATARWRNNKDCDRGKLADVEAFFYRDTCCFGVQGHPEYRTYNYFTKWCLEKIDNYVVCNPDIDWQDGYRRMKQEFIDERDAKAALRLENLIKSEEK